MDEFGRDLPPPSVPAGSEKNASVPQNANANGAKLETRNNNDRPPRRTDDDRDRGRERNNNFRGESFRDDGDRNNNRRRYHHQNSRSRSRSRERKRSRSRSHSRERRRRSRSRSRSRTRRHDRSRSRSRGPIPSPENAEAQRAKELQRLKESAWTCTRCNNRNDAGSPRCNICNIAFEVSAGGKEATIALSTAHKPQTAQFGAFPMNEVPTLPTVHSYVMHAIQELQRDPNLNMYAFPPMSSSDRKDVHFTAENLGYYTRSEGSGAQWHLVIYRNEAAFRAIQAAKNSTKNGDAAESKSLVKEISDGQVLFLKNLSPVSTVDSIRSSFVRFAAVRDVLLPLPLEGNAGAHLCTAFVVFESAQDCTSIASRLKSQVPPFAIDDTPIQLEIASGAQLSIAVRHQMISWNEQASTHSIPKVGGSAASHTPVASPSLLQQSQTPPRPVELAATFLYDPSSQLWHDPTSGYYYNAATHLYYHSADGSYSRWDAALQRYVHTDPAGNPLPVPAAIPNVSVEAQQYLAMKAAQELVKSNPSLPIIPPVAVSSTGVVQPSGIALTTTFPDRNQFLDPSRFACLLCNRQMKSLELLYKHVELSALHKTNLENLMKTGVPPSSLPSSDLPPLERPPAASSVTTPALSGTSSPRIIAVPSPAGAAAKAGAPNPHSKAESEYLRQMQQFKALDRDDEAIRPLLK